ncbi:P fimbrial regulatory protein KS71A [Leminorella richardii]|uniref:P fimbrial regulatory protein KS71A n=1 Tax=Leminorella richardii TaxID=158841 RepID=A0A2X4VET8_9GAMM|nr:FaeA/PapI family transcriptional regulator [Leminorella richardii]SQI43810.1 P fimbrial regulatory protein KS71A [Leminorella richardii]
MKNNDESVQKVTKGAAITQEIVDALAQKCAEKYAAVKDEVSISDNMSDETLRKIAPTTNDIAESCIINVYQARYYLLKLMEEGLVLKTGVKKGYPLHWWLLGSEKQN